MKMYFGWIGGIFNALQKIVYLQPLWRGSPPEAEAQDSYPPKADGDSN